MKKFIEINFKFFDYLDLCYFLLLLIILIIHSSENLFKISNFVRNLQVLRFIRLLVIFSQNYLPLIKHYPMINGATLIQLYFTIIFFPQSYSEFQKIIQTYFK